MPNKFSPRDLCAFRPYGRPHGRLQSACTQGSAAFLLLPGFTNRAEAIMQYTSDLIRNIIFAGVKRCAPRGQFCPCADDFAGTRRPRFHPPSSGRPTWCLLQSRQSPPERPTRATLIPLDNGELFLPWHEKRNESAEKKEPR